MKKLLLYTAIFIGGFISGIFTVAEPVVEEPIAVQEIPTFTGYELFNAANNYRVSQGLKPFILHQPLCNNIAGRYINYRGGNGHGGLNEFVEEYMPNEGQVGEILAMAFSAEDAVQQWSGSPSHDLFLKNNSKACAYAYDGYSVMLLSN